MKPSRILNDPFPSVPHDPVVTRGGMLHPSWESYFNLLTNNLQRNFSQDGHVIPKNTSSEVEQLTSTPANQAESTQRIVYNSDSDTFQGSTGGPFKSFQTYEELSGDNIDTIASGKRNGRLILNTTDNKLYIGVGDVFREVMLGA